MEPGEAYDRPGLVATMIPPPSAEADAQEAELSTLVAQWHALTARVLQSLDAFEVTQAWAGIGINTFGQWASINLGIRASKALAMVTTARALQKLPAVAAGLAQGRLSYDKAAALARVATPEREDVWLNLAEQASTAQLERVVAAYQRCVRPDPNDEFRIGLWARQLPNGHGRLEAELEGEDLARILAVIDAQVEDGWRAAGNDTTTRPVGALAGRRAEALVEVAELALAAAVADGATNDRAQLIVHVDHDMLAGTSEAGRCHLAQGPSLPVEAVRRMACDAIIRPLLTARDGRPLDVGRARRLPTGRQRRTLEARDGGCQFPGCARTRFTHAHHIVHWTDGGPTNLDNLVLLCRTHHRLHHEGGYAIARGEGDQLQFWRRTGELIGPAPPGPGADPPEPARPFDAGLPRAQCGGEAFSLADTISGLLSYAGTPAA